MLKIIPNPNVDIYNKITNAVIQNDGYCPCMLTKNQDTKCICKDFRDQSHKGECHCGRYVKIGI